MGYSLVVVGDFAHFDGVFLRDFHFWVFVTRVNTLFLGGPNLALKPVAKVVKARIAVLGGALKEVGTCLTVHQFCGGVTVVTVVGIGVGEYLLPTSVGDFLHTALFVVRELIVVSFPVVAAFAVLVADDELVVVNLNLRSL